MQKKGAKKYILSDNSMQQNFLHTYRVCLAQYSIHFNILLGDLFLTH
jgi:hypothetical protein